ncbi:hypothetical protein [Nocardioides mangrovi]|uniref:Peptidase S55 domain-containing protein n=1 Tax=Nocardioides mangrovi TaxID=2874580 RepID=A0ABS7UD74_9ACTN|nr:hypothetical protein [Nocardioides mangrovi]MBZ5738953.1 hypothetical protein [Nocardioides mangrovi]
MPRARALASLTAVLGLGLAAVAAVGTATPAVSADPAGDCATPFPEADLAAGDAVTGLTVTQGTTPESFTGEVLGILDDGIAPDVDMIMVRLSSPAIAEAGIWEGMSGSPVYAADGRLIGAVSYGLAYGHSPVAGVTPYESMDDYLADTDAAASKVAVGRTAARQIARRTSVTAAQASEGFSQLPMRMGVSGVGARRLAAVTSHAAGHRWLARDTYAVGSAGRAATSASDIVAGGNLAASYMYGDVTMAGVGTVTSVCGDRVVGFGHPMDLRGETSLALHPADTIYIQDDLVTSFKIANLGEPVGTITDDRTTGITGTLGTLPHTVTVSSTLTYGDRTRTGVTHVALDSADALASGIFYELIYNHQAVVDGPVRGTEDLAWTITGTDADGAPFELSSSDLYASNGDLTWRIGFGVGDFVYSLAKVPGISIDTISTTSELTDDVSTKRVGSIEVKQDGEWTKVSQRHPGMLSTGKHDARVSLSAGGEQTTFPFEVTIPQRFSGRLGLFEVVGGSNVSIGRLPKDLDKIKEALADKVRADEMLVLLRSGPKLHHGGHSSSATTVRGRSASGKRYVTQVIGPVDSVVKGYSAGLMYVG